MKKIVDLTHAMTDNMQVFPDDPLVKISTHHNYANGYLVTKLSFGTHTGTHIDVPAHRLKGQKTVDQVDIGRFIQRAYVMDLTALKPLEEIDASILERYSQKLQEVHAVILKTGWSSHFGSDDFFTSFPGLTVDAVNWLHDHQIGLIGLESPSVHAVEHMEIHKHLLEKDIYIVESLTNIDGISKEYVELVAVPLKLYGLDGSPVRAYAVEGD